MYILIRVKQYPHIFSQNNFFPYLKMECAIRISSSFKSNGCVCWRFDSWCIQDTIQDKS